MGDQNQPKPYTPSDEIDLSKLLQMLKKGLNLLFIFILRVFLYLKRNMVKLGILVLIGLLIGFLLNNFVRHKFKTDVIVKPNFESADYLYDVVNEIQSNLLSKDTLFFTSFGLNVNELGGLNIHIEPIEDTELDEEKRKEDNTYLRLLESYQENDFVLNIVKSEIGKKIGLTHRITFTYENRLKQKGNLYAKEIVNYINTNPYYSDLKSITAANASLRIAKNKEQIEQIDNLVNMYTSKLAKDTNGLEKDGLYLFENEKDLDVTNLLDLKNRLIKQIEEKQLELTEQKDPISIINFGKSQMVKSRILKNSAFLFPIILVGGFFAISFLGYLNRKAKDLL